MFNFNLEYFFKIAIKMQLKIHTLFTLKKERATLLPYFIIPEDMLTISKFSKY